MHHVLLLMIALSITNLAQCEQTLASCAPQPIILNNHIHTANTNQTQVTQESSLSSSVTNIQQLLEQARNQTQHYTYGILSWINQHKIKTTCYAALIGYGYLWYKLVSLNYTLMQATNWSKWHETLALEELLEKPQQEVATDLLTAIQRHYTTPEQFDDLLSPLIAFVRDVDKEIEQLRQIVNLHTWIDRLRVSFLFPKQSSLLSQAQDNIHRLTYLKNLLLNWVSQHKVARLTLHKS